MDNTIKKLVEENSNDSILGQKIREMYWRQHGLNEVTTDSNQMTLDQMINEVENS
jgi:hypothetical protein